MLKRYRDLSDTRTHPPPEVLTRIRSLVSHERAGRHSYQHEATDVKRLRKQPFKTPTRMPIWMSVLADEVHDERGRWRAGPCPLLSSKSVIRRWQVTEILQPFRAATIRRLVLLPQAAETTKPSVLPPLLPNRPTLRRQSASPLVTIPNRSGSGDLRGVDPTASGTGVLPV